MDEQLFIVLTLLFTPLAFLILLAVILASLGKSLGLRRKYADLMLKIFKWGQERIALYNETHRKQYSRSESEEEEEDDEELIRGEKENGHDQQVIRRDISISAMGGLKMPSQRPEYDITNLKKEFHISDIMYFAKCGVEAVIEDDVTQCFTAEELKSWNFLTRTTLGYQFISVRLTILWCLGCFVRYFILLPFRVLVLCTGLSWLILSTAIIGYLPESNLKKRLNKRASLMSHRMLARACSAVLTFHNRENIAKNGICVANHTSPIDVIILSCDSCYAMVGQAHNGFLGIVQRALSRATSHIWFERSEVRDRHLVARRLKEHVDNEDKLPILIFPEGTCINNTSVVMFKKGSFEVGSTIYPVAIKYDPRFGDAFWDSSKMGMLSHVFQILTSWALVADVWYLPPMVKNVNEDAVTFANRVKKEIARRGGLVDLEWDGQLKRMRVKDSWKSKPQEEFSKLLKVE
ncbi:glycerol-3-phosphate acyltransferase 3-like [Ylistrum balloti]|uniref:glycerol-3-phosphate acyltransferase 3-like n=1 Tax=Ylistrum balloti TaxID=509963 RepID=UPI00290598E5|nr:glycerol-3-phosphate acyltransferase 3-like [Ylistrum balloti]